MVKSKIKKGATTEFRDSKAQHLQICQQLLKKETKEQFLLFIAME